MSLDGPLDGPLSACVASCARAHLLRTPTSGNRRPEDGHPVVAEYLREPLQVIGRRGLRTRGSSAAVGSLAVASVRQSCSQPADVMSTKNRATGCGAAAGQEGLLPASEVPIRRA